MGAKPLRKHCAPRVVARFIMIARGGGDVYAKKQRRMRIPKIHTHYTYAHIIMRMNLYIFTHTAISMAT